MLVHKLQANFSRGAVSPLVGARHDKDFYAAAVADIENWHVLRYGVLRRRSGTRYVGAPKFPNKRCRFIPFQFDTTQAFFVELGDGYARFWTPAGLQVYLGDDPYEIVSPYDADDLDRLQFVQSGDTLLIAHPDHAPQRLTRAGNTNWSFSAVPFHDGPYLPINDTANTCDPSANPTVGGSLTLTFANTSHINGGAGFTSADIGRQVRVLCTTWCWFTITAVTNTTTVTVTSQSAGASHTAVTSWRLGAVAQSQGYFSSVEFYKGRLVWANTRQNPRAAWPSMANLPFRNDPSAPDGTVTSEHGFMIEVLAGSQDGILWMKESSRLQLGTASAIRTIGPNANGDEFGPRTYEEDLGVHSGTVSVLPTVAGPSTVHVGRFGLSLNDLYYDYQANGLVAPDISALSEHLLDASIVRLAYVQTPDSIIYGLLSNGKWFGATYDRYERVIGFHPHSTRQGDAVEDICVAPNASERRDVMFMVTRRIIGGETVRYIEILERDFYRQSKSDAWFVDCGVRYTGPPTTVVTGLTHLAGEVVSVFADGAAFPDTVVQEDGSVELPNNQSASVILVGLPLTASGKTLRPSIEGRDGPQHGLKKRTPYVVVDVLETAGSLQVSAAENERWEYVNFRKSTDPMDTAPPLFTGTKKKILDSSHEQDESDGQIMFRITQPLPATIRAMNVGNDIQP